MTQHKTPDSHGPKADAKKSQKEEREQLKKIPEKEIDETLKDTFPASDPPGGY